MKLNLQDKKKLLLLQEGWCFSSLSLKIMYASALNLSEWNFKDFSQFYSRNVEMSILVRIPSRFWSSGLVLKSKYVCTILTTDHKWILTKTWLNLPSIKTKRSIAQFLWPSQNTYFNIFTSWLINIKKANSFTEAFQYFFLVPLKIDFGWLI